MVIYYKGPYGKVHFNLRLLKTDAVFTVGSFQVQKLVYEGNTQTID